MKRKSVPEKKAKIRIPFCPPHDTDTYQNLPFRFAGPSGEHRQKFPRKLDDPKRFIKVELSLNWAEATALVNAAKRRHVDWQDEVFPGDEALRILQRALGLPVIE